MPPRWSRQAAVVRHDDFVAAPRVVDPHDSDPLPRDGPLEAGWYGPPARRAFAAASIVLVVAGIGLFGFFAISDLLGGSSGASDAVGPGGSAGSAAQPDGALPGDPGGVPPLDDPLANVTQTTQSPLPALS